MRNPGQCDRDFYLGSLYVLYLLPGSSVRDRGHGWHNCCLQRKQCILHPSEESSHDEYYWEPSPPWLNKRKKKSAPQRNCSSEALSRKKSVSFSASSPRQLHLLLCPQNAHSELPSTADKEKLLLCLNIISSSRSISHT